MQNTIGRFAQAFLINSIIVCVSLPAMAAVFDCVVVRVIDGDTIIVKRNNNAELTVDLYGIDAPETGQNFGKEAKLFLEKKTLNKKAALTIKSKASNRPQAEVWVLSGYKVCINETMLRKGLAWSVSKKYKRLENNARRKKLGVWSLPDPTPPNEYRKIAAAKKKVEEEKAKKIAEEKRSHEFLEEYLVESNFEKKRTREVTKYQSQTQYSTADIERILVLYDMESHKKFCIDYFDSKNLGKGKYSQQNYNNRLENISEYSSLILRCSGTVPAQESIATNQKKELMQRLEKKQNEIAKTMKDIHKHYTKRLEDKREKQQQRKEELQWIKELQWKEEKQKKVQETKRKQQRLSDSTNENETWWDKR